MTPLFLCHESSFPTEEDTGAELWSCIHCGTMYPRPHFCVDTCTECGGRVLRMYMDDDGMVVFWK